MEDLPDNVIPLFKPSAALDTEVARMVMILSREINELAAEALPEEELREHEQNRQSIIRARNKPQGLVHLTIGSFHRGG